MSGRRIDMHRLQELVRLHRMGIPCRRVAHVLKMGPNTERRYREALLKADLLLGEPADLPELDLLKMAIELYLPDKPAPQQASSVEDFRFQIETMWKRGAGPRAIFDALKLDESKFSGS